MANDLGAILIVNYDLSLSFVVSRGQRLFYGAVPIQSRHHSEFIWYSLFLVFKFIFLAPILDPLIHIHTFSQYFGSIITYSYFWPVFWIHYYIYWYYLAPILHPLLHIHIFGQIFGSIITYLYFWPVFWIHYYIYSYFWQIVLDFIITYIYVHKI